MALAEQQRKTRGELAAEGVREGKVLATLQVEKAGVDGERRKVEADLGPVRYLATLLGAADQDVLQYFILVVALLLDPTAVLLLLVATSARSASNSKAYQQSQPPSTLPAIFDHVICRQAPSKCAGPGPA
jgi:hypothetical protein